MALCHFFKKKRTVQIIKEGTDKLLYLFLTKDNINKAKRQRIDGGKKKTKTKHN